MLEQDMTLVSVKDIPRCLSADATAEATSLTGAGVPSKSNRKFQYTLASELVRRYLIQLDKELFTNGIRNPGGLYTSEMFVSTPVINMSFFDINTQPKLSAYLVDFCLDDAWLCAIWNTRHDKTVHRCMASMYEERLIC